MRGGGWIGPSIVRIAGLSLTHLTREWSVIIIGINGPGEQGLPQK